MNDEKMRLSKEKAFYFFTSIGNYTGESAASMADFLEKIMHIDIKSIEFHFHRGDFEKWLAETIGDKKLAEQIEKLHDQKLTGEKLRDQLHNVISKRYEKLYKFSGRS
jgi:benzoyl-CoA reductase/2-hydroxyglutaryl-CoA dehydratase subunit BcrC/BadD/HgdB